MISELDLQNIRKYTKIAQEFNFSELSEACEACVQFTIDNFSVIVANDWFLQELTADELLQCLKDDNLNVETEDKVLDVLCKWLKNSQVSSAKKEEYVDQLFPFVRLTLCQQSTLQNLVKDETLPPALKVKLYDHLFHDADENCTPRASYGTDPKDGNEQKGGQFQTSSVNTSTTHQEVGTHEFEEKIVIVGGKRTGYGVNENILYQDSDKQNTEITHTSSCKNQGYSVCATKAKIIVSGGYYYPASKKVPVYTSEGHQFCLRTLTWSRLHDLPYPRNHHSTLCIWNLLYVMGGCHTNIHEESNCYDVHVLDLDSRSWSAVKKMPVTGSHPDLAGVGSDIIVVLGKTITTAVSPCATVMYQTVEDQWKRCGIVLHLCILALELLILQLQSDTRCLFLI